MYNTHICVHTHTNTQHEWVYISTSLLIHINTHTSGIYSTKTNIHMFTYEDACYSNSYIKSLNIVAYAKLYKQIIFTLPTYA